MFFKKFRSRSKSSHSAKSHATDTHLQAAKDISKNDVVANVHERTEDDERDFQMFLAKAKEEEEKAEQRRLIAMKEAQKHHKQVNMSPWASRM